MCNAHIGDNGVKHVSPVSIVSAGWPPTWQAEATVPTPESGAAAEQPTAGEWDWWQQVTDDDLAFILRPKATACPLCRGRHAHSASCRAIREAERPSFGRHRGTAVVDLPNGYLRWMVSTLGPSHDIHDAATAELKARGL